MSYLGRPSGGDSPFAIGDRALRDKSSPQPPSQRNPTPRKALNQNAQLLNGEGGQQQQGGSGMGSMATPSPYGSVSDEARRRYEERYAKKRAEEEQKKAEERAQQEREANPQLHQQMLPPQQQYFQPPPRQGQPPQQQYQQQQQQQRPPSLQPQGQPQGGPPGGYGGPNMNNSPPPGAHPPQRWSNPNPPPGGYGGNGPPLASPTLGPGPGSQGHLGYNGGPRSQGGHSGPPSNQSHNSGYGSPNMQQGGPPARPNGPVWSTNAVPPPSQQWQQPQSPPQPPPRAEDSELRNLFSQFDSSRSGQLNSYDLQRLLAKDATMEAREDCVKMLMNIFDTDRSGSINFQEFEGLYRYIQDWHGIFLKFDRDGSGLIDRKELHQALLGFGFSLPFDMVRKLEKKYAPPPKPGHPPRKGISFDRFLMACVTVKHYTEAFRRTDVQGTGRITIDYNQFMDLILESPS